MGPLDETGKTDVPCHSKCDSIKIPPCSKAMSAERRVKFCSPSPAMVTYHLLYRICQNTKFRVNQWNWSKNCDYIQFDP
jgi:hypothetical protein